MFQNVRAACGSKFHLCGAILCQLARFRGKRQETWELEEAEPETNIEIIFARRMHIYGSVPQQVERLIKSTKVQLDHPSSLVCLSVRMMCSVWPDWMGSVRLWRLRHIQRCEYAGCQVHEDAAHQRTNAAVVEQRSDRSRNQTVHQGCVHSLGGQDRALSVNPTKCYVF